MHVAGPLNSCTCFEVVHYNDYCLSAVILIGDTGVGKTCLLRRSVENTFSNVRRTIPAINCTIQNVEIGREVIQVQIWDTGNCIICIWSLVHIGVITVIVVIDTFVLTFVNMLNANRSTKSHNY